MEASATVALVAAFVGGFGMQWLRGFKWFGDQLTYVVALLGGVLAAWLTHAFAADATLAVVAVMQHTLTILGGTMVGHTASQTTALAPRFNQFSKEAP